MASLIKKQIIPDKIIFEYINLKLKTENFKLLKMKGNFETIINDSKPVVVDFHALWCGPCKVQSPILKELATELGEKVKVIKIDVDQNPELAVRYQIQGVPTIMIFKNGKSIWRQSGVASKTQLKNVIMQNT